MGLTCHFYETDEVVAALQWCILQGRVTEAAYWCQELMESESAELEGAIRSVWLWHFGIGCLGIGRQIASGNYLEITVTLARSPQWRDASVFALLGAKVTDEFDRVNEWDVETEGMPPRRRSFHRALKQRKALLAWAYARTAWPAAWDWMSPTVAPSATDVWATRALAVAAAALTPAEREKSLATSWRLVPADLEATMAEWHEVVGRPRRVYGIPQDCLYWLTRRGKLTYKESTAATIQDKLEDSLQSSPYWSAQLPPDFDKKEDAYDDFYMSAFPNDIPDEWSRADRLKSHGDGVLNINETANIQKFARRWYARQTSRILYAGVERAVPHVDWDKLYEESLEEWKRSDSTWKLTPVKKKIVVAPKC
jgi:hypothetical protein